eukprot:8961565-Alexandrium_andersonii.AAC.1
MSTLRIHLACPHFDRNSPSTIGPRPQNAVETGMRALMCIRSRHSGRLRAVRVGRMDPRWNGGRPSLRERHYHSGTRAAACDPPLACAAIIQSVGF